MIKRFFPALCINKSVAHQTIIAIRLCKLVAVQNARFEAQQVEREEKAAKLVTKWLGDNNMNTLLHTMGCRNKE